MGGEAKEQGRGDGALGAALGVGAMSGLSYGLVFPVAALYGEAAGLSPAAITALVALHPLMRLVSGPVWGRLADRLGRRPVLLAGLALGGLGHLIFGLVGGPLGLGLGRLLTGLGSGEAVAAFAVVADRTTPEKRAEGLGMLRAAVGLGMLAGPLVGGALGLVSLNLPGLAAAGLSVLAFRFVWRRLPETRIPGVVEADPGGDLGVPRRALLVVGAGSAALTLAEAIVPLAIEHVLVPRLGAGTIRAWVPDWTDPQVALLLTVGVILAWGLTTAVFDAFLTARIVGRLGVRRALRLGLALWAVAFLVTPLVYQLGVLPGGLVVAATAIPVSLTNVSLSSWLSRAAGPSRQGRVTGAAQSALAVGEVLGPASAGWLYSTWYGLPYQVGAALLFAALLVSITLRLNNSNSTDR